MDDKPDHLIERAAALLRSAAAANPEAGAEAPARAPRIPSRPIGAAPMPHTPPPLFVPPRPIPGAGVSAMPLSPVPGRPRPAAPPLGSVAELPPSAHPPVTLDTLERAGLMVARTKRTRIAEEYRIVIGRVLRAMHEDPEGEPPLEEAAANVIMVTSARPGEGKSFSALNLAGSIAQNVEQDVLLVDVDAKVKPISHQLGLDAAPGFMDMIAKPDLSPDGLIYRTELLNLSVIPLGTSGMRRGASSAEGKVTEIRNITPAIHRIARRFPKTVLVLDAPPCLSTSDPHTIAPHVHQVVLVVEAERTQRSEVEAALDLVRVCPNITMLLNKVRLSTTHTFGAYDYFGTYT